MKTYDTMTTIPVYNQQEDNRVSEALWLTLKKQGWYITQRGEGKCWFLHAPDGRPTLLASTRQELMQKLPRQFA